MPHSMDNVCGGIHALSSGRRCSSGSGVASLGATGATSQFWKSHLSSTVSVSGKHKLRNSFLFGAGVHGECVRNPILWLFKLDGLF